MEMSEIGNIHSVSRISLKDMTYRSLAMDQATAGVTEIDFDPDTLPTWRDDAVCRGFDISVFFPDESDSTAIAHAKGICTSCSVQQECTSYAVERNQTDGIWGGTTRQQRRRLRRIWIREMREAG